MKSLISAYSLQSLMMSFCSCLFVLRSEQEAILVWS